MRFSPPACWLVALVCCVLACSEPQVAQVQEAVVAGSAPFAFRAIEDNLRHDTLLIQTTFDLGDSTFVMVASHREEKFEGLRLYRYRARADSSAELIAASSPAFDSWTMLPTFFPVDTAQPSQAAWVLANFGERESWGQKLFRMSLNFVDMGFMDVAMPERVEEDGESELKRRNIGPSMRYEERNDTAYFRFACDSVYLYDDQAGQMDQVLPSRSLHYTYHPGEGLALWLNGEKRLVKKPV